MKIKEKIIVKLFKQLSLKNKDMLIDQLIAIYKEQNIKYKVF